MGFAGGEGGGGGGGGGGGAYGGAGGITSSVLQNMPTASATVLRRAYGELETVINAKGGAPLDEGLRTSGQVASLIAQTGVGKAGHPSLESRIRKRPGQATAEVSSGE